MGVRRRSRKMATGTIRRMEDRPGEAVLHVAFELDDLRWTLTMGTGMGRRARHRRVRPRDREAVLDEIAETQRRFRVVGGRVVSCYEAGREGFWLHRFQWSERSERNRKPQC
jgi:transposase